MTSGRRCAPAGRRPGPPTGRGARSPAARRRPSRSARSPRAAPPARPAAAGRRPSPPPGSRRAGPPEGRRRPRAPNPPSRASRGPRPRRSPRPASGRGAGAGPRGSGRRPRRPRPGTVNTLRRASSSSSAPLPVVPRRRSHSGPDSRPSTQVSTRNSRRSSGSPNSTFWARYSRSSRPLISAPLSTRRRSSADRPRVARWNSWRPAAQPSVRRASTARSPGSTGSW